MKRDIDSIIEQVREQLPNVIVNQMQKIHKADDDGIWWFRLPNVENDIQVESSLGNCPFLIEHDGMESTAEAITGKTIIDVVNNVVGYLQTLK